MAKRFTTLLIIVLALAISISLWARYNNLSVEGMAIKALGFFNDDPIRYQANNVTNNAGQPDHSIWTAALKDFVTEDGLVDYKSWRIRDSTLNRYIESLSNNPPHESWTEGEELTYWINAYNAFTIRLILDHYPLQSIQDIGGNIPMINSSWEIDFITIGGQSLNLSDIEHRILRKYYDEPRVHFAINCASISCPKLSTLAFEPEVLEEQLTDQVRSFLSDSSKNKLGAAGVIHLSPIFKWFSEDFGDKDDLITLINQYGDYEYGEEVTIKYLEYDWGLNDIFR